MPDTPLSEKTGRAILEELRAIRRNQEAQMPQGMVEQARMQRFPVQTEAAEPSGNSAKTSTKFDVSKAPSRRGGG